MFVIEHYFFLKFITNVEAKINEYLWKKNQLKY